ncbi:MAG: Gfo/Idh/MocA family oxidoreductase [Anaerolineaceae bacterium]|nr:Gfo/Idh/MocA family oxidoreductase [Anaerolineaceae bacterium]
MKFLIAGYGSIGRRHMRNLIELGQNDIILLRSHKSTLPEDEIKGIPVETSIEAALAHNPDGVIIANPTALHMDIAIAAANAGCAVFMEKPLSDSLERMPELREALKKNGERFQMGFQFRFHPGLATLKELLDNDAIGTPYSFRAEWGEYLPGWHPWEDYRQSYSARKDLGGGVLLTLSHPLDYIRWLFGDPEWIWGMNGKISELELDTDDIAEIGLRMANGLVGTIHLDYYSRPTRNGLEVISSKGKLRCNNLNGIVTLSPSDGIAEQHEPEPPYDRNNMFLDEMRRFIEVTSGNAQPSCTLEDGIAAQRMVELIRRSWEEKRILKFEV